MTRVTIHAAKTHFSRLVARAEAGETILIVRGQGNEPVARLAPLRRKRRVARAGWLKGQIEVPDDSVWAPMTEEEAEAEGWQ